MKKRLRNEKGLSLAELLAVLAIGSFIMIFIMSIHVLIQKQYKNQKEDALHLTDVTIAAKEITKDIRSYEETTANGSQIWFCNNCEENEKQEKKTYELVDNVLKKDGLNYIYEIDEFIATENDQKVKLIISSVTGQKIETEIFIR